MSGVEIVFLRDIRPLFRAEDREAMEAWFDLFSYTDVRGQAPLILFLRRAFRQ